MNIAIPLAAAAAALLALSGRRSAPARRAATPARTSAPAASRVRVCTYNAQTLPIESDALVMQWARCAGRTAGEIEGVAGRGAAAGRPAAWVDRLRRTWQQSQALARRPPDGLSSSARREVDRALGQTDQAARSRPMPEEPETLADVEAEKARAAAIAQQRAEAAARGRAELDQEQAQQGAGASVSGADAEPVEIGAPIAIEIENAASGYDPQLARRLASQTARAVRERLPGAALNVNHFRQAAGLGIGPYDGRTAAALRHFGIRRPPDADGPPQEYTPPRADR